jgi:hypothetical protein
MANTTQWAKIFHMARSKLGLRQIRSTISICSLSQQYFIAPDAPENKSCTDMEWNHGIQVKRRDSSSWTNVSFLNNLQYMEKHPSASLTFLIILRKLRS